MIKLKNGKMIDADLETVLHLFKQYAQDNGVNVFKDIQNKGTKLWITCPNKYHKNRAESKPSCTVNKKLEHNDRGVFPVGCFSCFSCKYVATLEEVISDVMGHVDNGQFGIKWLVDNFILAIEENLGFELNFGDKVEKPIEYVNEDELDSYRYHSDYWEKRGIDEKTQIRFDLGYDSEFKGVTMPVWDNDGNCVGVTKRKVKNKFYKIPKDMPKPVYLLNFAIKEKWGTIHICESQINALYLNSLGYHAVGLFGTGSVAQAQELKKVKANYVFVFDGDEAGDKGSIKMNKLMGGLNSYVDLPDNLDINDLNPQQVHELLSQPKLFGF